jgi:AmmeMemoRadiSam system protein B
VKRQPAVAGQFYSGNSKQLRSDLAEMIPDTPATHKVIGIMAPHAGYVYSGAIAGAIFSSIKIPTTVLILGPNHHGTGAGVALYPDGEWITPLGTIHINSRLNSLLQHNVPFVQSDTAAHEFEHSLEVQVPFIQYLQADATVCAICLGQGDFVAVRKIGEAVAAAIRAYGSDVLIVASSDMTHYESADSAKRKDSLALDRVLNFDPQGLLQVCRDEQITMCGAVPAAVMLVAAGQLGATQSEQVAYGNSGDVTGDNRQVVGYAAGKVW